MKSCCSRVCLRLPGFAAAVVLLGHGLTAGAQELEPRRWSHLPENFNFVGAAYAVTQADIYVDPVLELVDVELDLQTAGAKYIRTFGLLGNSARVDITVPYQDAHWEGLEHRSPPGSIPIPSLPPFPYNGDKINVPEHRQPCSVSLCSFTVQLTFFCNTKWPKYYC